MWVEDDDEAERIERTFDVLFTQALAGMEDSLFDVGSRALKPLYKIEVNDEMVTVTFDLPYAVKERLTLSSTEETLSIEAELAAPVRLRVGSRHNNADFERYSKKIRLPVRVDPAGGTARFRGGLLVVKLPIAHRGTPVKIG